MKGIIRAKRLVWQWHLQLLYAAAYIWRTLLLRTTFIAITGSVGKTTTKESIAAILSAHFPTAKTLLNQNDRYGVPRTILRIRPWHRFAVIETGTDRPGLIYSSARLIRPHIAVVLTVGKTHTNVFKTLDDTAAEKARILDALRPEGLAILNADDPRVRRMADGRQCRVKLFGRSAGLDLWADDISSQWPARLSFRVHTRSESRKVNTKMVGEHWLNTALAALLTALSCGVRLQDAASSLEQVKPVAARMQPIVLPSGATVLRDEVDGSAGTLEPALQVLKQSSSVRRFLVISDVSDFGNKKPRVRLRDLGKAASEVADFAVFISNHANYAVKAAVAGGMKPECVAGFTNLRGAAEYLHSELRSNDIVLLRGRTTDHLSRVFFAQFGPIGCWKTVCRKTINCDHCEELRPSFDLTNAALHPSD